MRFDQAFWPLAFVFLFFQCLNKTGHGVQTVVSDYVPAILVTFPIIISHKYNLKPYFLT